MARRDQRDAATSRDAARSGDRRGSDDEGASTFLRALSVGALVGAALAGSALLAKLRGSDDEQKRDVGR